MRTHLVVLQLFELPGAILKVPLNNIKRLFLSKADLQRLTTCDGCMLQALFKTSQLCTAKAKGAVQVHNRLPTLDSLQQLCAGGCLALYP